MSRPRKPFGASHPGRLPATMMKVLAAEMSDPSRLRRGKQYARDGSVLDIVIEPGIVTCEIQGSRSTPYVASVEVTAGDGMPLRRDITTACTCPDDDNWDGYTCKHVVAAMFTLSDEFLLEPELLDVWRNRPSGVNPVSGETTTSYSSVGDRSGRAATTGRHLRLVGSDDRAVPEPDGDPLAGLLTAPAGTSLPDLPVIERVDPVVPRSPDIATPLRDAIAHLRIEWD